MRTIWAERCPHDLTQLAYRTDIPEYRFLKARHMLQDHSHQLVTE